MWRKREKFLGRRIGGGGGKALKARPIRADSENGEHPALRSVVGVHTMR